MFTKKENTALKPVASTMLRNAPENYLFQNFSKPADGEDFFDSWVDYAAAGAFRKLSNLCKNCGKNIDLLYDAKDLEYRIFLYWEDEELRHKNLSEFFELMKKVDYLADVYGN